MRDDATDDLTIRYVLGELLPHEAAAFEQRLATERELKAEVERLGRTYALVGMSAATAPPPELRARVLSGAPARRATRSVPRPALSQLVTAIAATMAIVFGIDGYRTRREIDLQRSLTAALQEPNVVQTFAMGGAGGEGGVGRVALDLDGQKGALVMRGLAPLGEGRVYRLWAAVGDKTIPCGDFHAAANGDALAQFRVPIEQYTEPVRRLFVTVEPAGPGDAPTGPEVMRSV